MQNSKNGIKIPTFVKVMAAVFLVLAGMNITFVVLSSQAKDRLVEVYEARRTFELAVHMLETGSLELTLTTRAYAVAGAPFLFEMWEELLEVDRGEVARQVFVYYNAPENELYMLNRALYFYENLRLLDKAAIEAYKAGDYQLAMATMYGSYYADYGFAFLSLLDDLADEILLRTQKEVDAAQISTDRFENLAQVATVLFTLVSFLGVIGAISISAKSERENKLREAVEEESRSKTKFLTRMSHEIHTPMNAVMGIAELQLQKSDNPPETEEAFLRIYSSSRLLLAILNDILDLSKVEAGKMEIVPATYDITSLIVDTVQFNLVHIGSKNIKFELTVDEHLPVSLIGDELRIKQVLSNLLSNAFKYTQEGVVALSVGAEYSQTGDMVLVFTLCDTGQGMSEEQMENLFSIEFTQFNIKANYFTEGTGLGMNIAYSLIKMMKGDISVESELGKGSKFTVRIPQKVHSEHVLGKETVKSLQNLGNFHGYMKRLAIFTREPMPYGRVLAVDDVESNLYVIKGFLLQYKIAAETAESGFEAIEKIKSGKVYDIIFMDYMMPDMDGIETTKAIRDMGYSHPIVALTTNTLKGAAEMFMSNGFSGFLSKPIDLYHLNAYLLRFIRDKQPPEVIEASRAAGVQPADFATAQQGALAGSGLEEIFLREANKAIDILEPIIREQVFDSEALKAYTIQTHAMKSSLANVGLAELTEVAFVMEQAGRSGDIETIIAQTPAFIDNLRKICVELAPEDAKNDAVDADPDFLKEQLLVLKEACESFDMAKADRALEKLDRKTWSNQTKALLSEIESHLLRGSLEEVAELVVSNIS